MSTIKEIPAFQLSTIYRILLKRISKGYSAAHLAFLIGAPERYISDVETLERSFYSIDDLERITNALEESNLHSLFSLISNEDAVKITAYKERIQGKIIHTYYNVDNNNNEQELFRLQEDEFPELVDLDQSIETLDLVSDTIDILIRSGYFFEPRLPYEIFRTVNSLRPEPLNPVYIQYALKRFCGDEGDDVKLRITGSFNQAYRYEEC
jgi:transcriptional regulator with XRE-family HTH domain